MCVLGRPWKRIDTMKDCLRKRGLDVGRTVRMVQDRSECVGRHPGDEPSTLTRCHSYMKPLKGGTSSAAKLAF